MSHRAPSIWHTAARRPVAAGEHLADGREPAPAPTYCGGFANIACPKDQVCVDDPNDDCDPKHGGADCGGICEPAPKHPHKPRKPHKPHHHDRCDDAHASYVSHSPATCAALRFICSEGQSPFFDDCGCGCE